MFRNMPILLLSLMILMGLFHPWIPSHIQSLLYGLSLSIKSLILFTLPFVIFGLLFSTAVEFSQKASKTILLILSAICLSNFLSTLLSYSVGHIAYTFDLSMSLPSPTNALKPSSILQLPHWIENSHAMLAALILGITLGRKNPTLAAGLSTQATRLVSLLLKNILYMIPLFIAGSMIKMYHDNIMGTILQNYAAIFALTACSLFTYIAILYFLSTASITQGLKNMLPAAIAGFGSMSSAAAMPLTLLGVQKNSPNPHLARSIIPITVNVHLIGDCFAIPIFAFAVMKSFAISEPSLAAYLYFAAYFVLAKFSVAAVPGGGILVMLPILEHAFGFDTTMLSLITSLYILFDPVITCANVLGNGAFAQILSKLPILSPTTQKSP